MNQESEKYITHTATGLPIRIPPYLRRGLRRNDESARVQLEMIKRDPRIGQRSEKDTLPANMEKNIRYRKLARVASRLAVDYAEALESNRYCTIINGSVAKGLIRASGSPDPSDIDIHLIIDDAEIHPLLPAIIQADMDALSYFKGVKIDIHVWPMAKVRTNQGEQARSYLRSAAYPIINKGDLWEEIQSVGIEAQRYFSLAPSVRRKLRKSAKSCLSP